MNEQIEKIAQGPKCSAREVIISSGDVNQGMEDCTAGLDADDDVDQYFKQRMLPDSANSQQSPQIPQSRRTRRGRSPRSTSPDNSNAVPFPESTAGAQPQPHPLMTQSYINPISREYPLEFARPPTNYLNTGDEMATSMRFAHQQRAGINASDVRYSHHKSCSPNRLNEVNTGFSGMLATTSYYGDVVIPPNVQNMSQSAYVCPNSNRQNKMGFAPPPGSAQTHHQIAPQLKPKDGYCENDEDTSGIGSMTTHFTSTYFSDHSTNSYNKQRAAVFKKARQLSSAQGAGQQIAQRNKRRTGVQEFSQSSLPRPKQNDASLPSPSAPKMTISYKPCRFFFKTSCEDGSAPYQLLLVNDDSAILPVFEGKISAECRSLSEDSE
uniref:DIX domain-containing protein n=1 Tax=Ditylenchus dipsaci TaxID=166011 RepID=A0A915CWF0_9BILA